MVLGCQTQRAATDQCSGAGGSQRGPQAAVWRPTRASKNHCSSEGTLLRAFLLLGKGLLPVYLSELQRRNAVAFAGMDFSFYIIHPCGGGGMHMPQRVCGDQRTACGSPSSPATMWVLGIELRSSGLVTNTRGATSLAQEWTFHASERAEPWW